ncbi:hypothetical protein GCM10011316_02430 [Roseibium aquae]|uniref:Uncharacterized protein n=1 Tax=Roseibium aquae TaxID=1323746 RepID=A0A916T7Z5_9HYPH|nr:hypothetical protein [Roseibium aquae]GGB33859.1 hypothetical protein GCM10011316_02430 [Roseibium aquae]
MKSGHRAKHTGRLDGWRDRLEYRLLVAITFVLCLVMVSATRSIAALKGKPVSETGQSLVAEAWSAAHAIAGYAFLA